MEVTLEFVIDRKCVIVNRWHWWIFYTEGAFLNTCKNWYRYFWVLSDTAVVFVGTWWMVIQGWYCNGHDKCCSITLDQSCPLPPPKTDPSPSLLPFQAFVTFASAQLFNAIILNSAPSKLCHLHKMDFFNMNTKGHPIFISQDFFIQAIYGFQLEILIVQSIFEQSSNNGRIV